MTKENITEMVRGSGAKPNPLSKPMGAAQGKTKISTTKTPIRKIDPKQFDNRSAAVTTNTPTGGSLKAGSFGISKAGRDQAAQNRAEFKAKIDAVKASSNKSSTPVVSDKTKQGKPRTKAQMMAAKRIASGKTIADVKKANMDAMRARAAEKFADFKAKREAKRLERMKEEYTPYDMVLEYLLSTEQVATIEEANYVMTEMDADTIQGIVEEQEKNLDEKFNIGKITLGQIGSTALKAGLGVGAYKLAFGGGKGDTPSTPSPVNTPNISDDKNKKKNKGEDLLKQGIEVIKKAKENPGTGLNPNTREALKIMNNNGY